MLFKWNIYVFLKVYEAFKLKSSHLFQKVEQYSRQINKLKDKIGCLKARKDELETLKETLG